MKHLKTAIFAIALVFSSLSAEAKLLEFGVAAGTSNSNYTIKGFDDATENQMGFRAGVSLAIKLPPFIMVTPEVWYNQNTFKITDASVMGGTTAQMKVQSVEMPVLLGLSIIGPLKLEVGPRISLYDEASVKLDADGAESVSLGGISPEFGYTVGLKLMVLQKIMVGARFNGNLGTSKVALDGVGQTLRNYNCSVIVGYRF